MTVAQIECDRYIRYGGCSGCSEVRTVLPDDDSGLVKVFCKKTGQQLEGRNFASERGEAYQKYLDTR